MKAGGLVVFIKRGLSGEAAIGSGNPKREMN